MRLATAADIRRLDERAEKEFGMSRLLLMENAGASVVIAMEKVFGALDGKRVTILCGKGGNGGDGMCAARHLVAHGASVVVGLVGTAKDLRGEPLANWTILDRMGLTPKELHTEGDLAWVRAAAGASDYIVDGLVGVGARLPLAGLLGDIVKTVNAAGKPVVAIDLPSGVDPDTGHRVVRLTSAPGSARLYFNQSGYTPDGASNAYTFKWTGQNHPFEDESRLKHGKSVALVIEAASGQTGTFEWSKDYLAGTVSSNSFTCSAVEFAEDPGVGVVAMQIGGSFKVIQPSVSFPINGDAVTLHAIRMYASPGAIKTG